MSKAGSVSGFGMSPLQSQAWRRRRGSVPRVQCALRLDGDVDAAALRARLQQLTDAHELLRTRFVRPAGLQQPLQVIDDAAVATLALEHWPAAEFDARYAALAAAEVDAERSGLLDARLVQRDDGVSLLLLSAPLLLCDGAGLLRLAEALLGAADVAEPDAEVLQYADVSRWLESLLEPGEGDEGRAWWRAACAELPAMPLLAGERPGPAAGATVSLQTVLGAPMAAALEAAGEGAESLLLALWCTVLARACRQPAVAVAVAADGRGDEELAGVFGPLTRYLPLRANVDEAQPLSALAATLQRQLAQAQEWQEYWTGETLPAIDGETGYLPYAFALTRTSLAAPLLQHDAQEEPSHLCLRVLAQNGRWTVQLAYDPARYAAAQAQVLLEQYRTVLAEALAAPGACLNVLSHVSAAERARLLAAAEADDAVVPLGLHQLFEIAAAAHPQRLALASAQGDWRYAQLESEANRLAHYLIAHGLRPQTRVAVCLDREPRLIVALLGLWKAGGVYVPVDPEFHPQRIRHLLADAGCGLLLSDRAHANVLGEDAQPVLLDELDGVLADYPATAPEIFFDPRQLAYLIYTSGSTGRPKGVAVSHAAGHTYVRGVLARLALSETAQLLSLATIGADLGHTALLGALCGGRSLRLIGAGAVLDAQGLADELAARPVDCLKIVPTHLRALLSAENPARLLPRECLVLGGSALEGGLVAQVRALAPGLRIVNHYGPTETTVGVTTQTVEQAGEGTQPIGRALRNSRAYVLDAQGRLAGEGMAGELHIGGAALAQGYWNESAQTAQKFIPDAFGAQPGGRLYRTGDLAYVSEGRVHFLGRVDHQVKIRGYRVELGEVEAVLCRHAQVDDAVVVWRDERLWAYVVSAVKPDTAALREWLRGELPDYMVPSAWLVLRQLPLNRNGKVDRAALPEIGPQASARPYVAPRTALEGELVALWQSLLGAERVGVEDNYFELGGDSIIAIQIAARLNKAGWRLLPKQIFEQQTIATIAARLQQVAAPVADQSALSGPVALNPIQARFFDLHPEGLDHFNQAVALRDDSGLDAAGLAAVLQCLHQHHDALRSRFERSADGSWRQQVGPVGAAAVLQHVDLAQLPPALAEAQAQRCAAAVQESLSLGRGLLSRALSLRLPDSRRLVWCIHHLLVDGVSWRVLLEDLMSAAAQQASGEAIALPPKTESVQVWSEALRDYAQTPALQAEAAYWQAMSEAVRVREPGTDPRSDTAAAVRSVAAELDEAQTEALLTELPRRLRSEINDALLAALSLAWQSWQGETDLLVELEGHGREPLHREIDVTRTVGWFTARYPLRLRGDGDDAIARLRAVKEARRALPANGVGFGVLRYLGDAATAARLSALRAPLIGLNYLGQLGQEQGAGAPFQVLPGQLPNLHSPRTRRAQRLMLSGAVAGRRLALRLDYDETLYAEEHAAALLAEFSAALARLVESARALQGHAYTPSDFPEAQLSQQALDELAAGAALDAIYPLSPLQHGLLFETLLRPGSGINVLQLDVGIDGELDVAALREAWRDLARRHPILRSVFSGLDGERPLQRVHSEPLLDWQVLDWRGLDAPAQGQRLAEFLEQDRTAPFALEREPATRVRLLRLDEARYRLIWTRHHAIVDGWSSAIVLRELMEIYAHRRAGAQAALAPAQDYRAYIRWLLARERDGGAENYWREYLRDAGEPTRIGAGDGWQRRLSEAKADEHVHTVSATLGAALRQVAQKQQVTVSSLFQAAWSVLLARLDGRRDVVFGTVASGRPAELPDVESIVGPLINTLPLRVRLDGADVGEWLRGLQRGVLERDTNGYLPLARIQQLAARGGAPLFASLLVVQNYVTEVQRKALEDDRQRVDFQIGASQTSYKISYPLTAFVTLAEQPSVRLCYDRDSFDAARVQEFGAVLEQALQCLADEDMDGLLQLAAAPAAAPAAARPRLRFHHLGVASPDLAAGLAFVRAQFEVVAVSQTVHDPLQDADLVLIETANGMNVELVAGAQVANLLARGVTLYHTCFEVDDLDAELQAICRRGGAVVAEPKPALLFGGRRVAFAQTPMGLVELLETTAAIAGMPEPAPPPLRVAVAGTFTLDPLQEALTHALELAGHRAVVEMAPYAQLFQQLVDPASLLRRGQDGANLLVLRWEDWFGARDAADEQAFERHFGEFRETLRHVAQTSGVVYHLLLAPPSPALREADAGFHARRTAQLAEAFADLPTVRLIDGETAFARFALSDGFDAESEQLAHLPYTPEAYTALALEVARDIHVRARAPFKVIVVDCDDTLWGGTAAEVGAAGVALTPARLALQQLLVEQQQAGLLLCLCSRNVEADVFAVFDTRADMRLRREHLLGWRINWQAKSDNLRSLARELDLGLDSFIFIDDDAVQCAEVRAHCPEVLTLQLPREEAAIAAFLRQCWAFDQPGASGDGRRRTALYRGNLERAREAAAAPNLRDFIASLQLQIELRTLVAADIERAAELSLRTNQFNLSGRRYAAAELAAALREGLQGFSVRLADRFGDYGLVGVALYRVAGAVLIVDSLLLSCRALGRGVEHRMLAGLARDARELGAATVQLDFVASARNQPVADFLAGNFAGCGEPHGDALRYRLPAAAFADFAWQPDAAAPAAPVREPAEGDSPRTTLARPPYQAIAEELADLAALTARIRLRSLPAARALKPYVAPVDEIDGRVCALWAGLLGLPRIGIKDHFFELGGHSLIATRVIAWCQKEYGVAMPLARIFEAPVVEDFAQSLRLMIWARSAAQTPAAAADEDVEEGAL